MFRPGDDSRHSRDAETALIAGLFSVLLRDHGIDQGVGLSFLHLHHDDPLQDPYLGRCQSDAAGSVHCLQHVLRERSDAGRHLFDHLCLFFEDRIPHLPDVSECHVNLHLIFVQNVLTGSKSNWTSVCRKSPPPGRLSAASISSIRSLQEISVSYFSDFRYITKRKSPLSFR